VYNSTGLIDAVDFGKAGYVTNTNDIDGIVSAMEYAIDNSEDYAKIRKAAHLFSKMFSWKATGRAFTEFLEQIQSKPFHGTGIESWRS
jgi:glycosyltransferase involved in cell wall biosynthesis